MQYPKVLIITDFYFSQTDKLDYNDTVNVVRELKQFLIGHGINPYMYQAGGAQTDRVTSRPSEFSTRREFASKCNYISPVKPLKALMKKADDFDFVFCFNLSQRFVSQVLDILDCHRNGSCRFYHWFIEDRKYAYRSYRPLSFRHLHLDYNYIPIAANDFLAERFNQSLNADFIKPLDVIYPVFKGVGNIDLKTESIRKRDDVFTIVDFDNLHGLENLCEAVYKREIKKPIRVFTRPNACASGILNRNFFRDKGFKYSLYLDYLLKNNLVYWSPLEDLIDSIDKKESLYLTLHDDDNFDYFFNYMIEREIPAVNLKQLVNNSRNKHRNLRSGQKPAFEFLKEILPLDKI
jgi:hypothetical protein